MADVPLPAEGPQRLIYLRALRAYSDNCEAPELTPGCPYFQMTESGPSCGEECLELLTEHGSDADSPGGIVVDLGNDFIAVRRQSRRPRARRSRDRSGVPVDIGRMRRMDADRPVEQRQTTSLVSELREQLITPPWLQPDPRERAWAIRASREELTHRGIDVEGLIRYAIGPQIGRSCLLWLRISASSPAVGLPPDPAWADLLESTIELPLNDPSASPHLGRFISGVAAWAATAPLDEVEAWAAPTEFPAAEPDRDKRRAGKADWTLNRFAETYLSAWTTSSLHMEWLYQHGSLPGPCDPGLMHDRPVDRDSLAVELATRSTQRWQQDGGPERGDRPPIRAGNFTSVAVENIRAGRTDVAAGIFEGCTRIDPDDPTAHHNYGFCLIPTDPEAAFSSLSRADKLGFDVPILNAADRVLALHLLGRDDEARDLGQLSLEANHAHTYAYLWKHGEGGFELIESADVHSYLRQLLDHIGLPG